MAQLMNVWLVWRKVVAI